MDSFFIQQTVELFEMPVLGLTPKAEIICINSLAMGLIQQDKIPLGLDALFQVDQGSILSIWEELTSCVADSWTPVEKCFSLRKEPHILLSPRIRKLCFGDTFFILLALVPQQSSKQNRTHVGGIPPVIFFELDTSMALIDGYKILSSSLGLESQKVHAERFDFLIQQDQQDLFRNYFERSLLGEPWPGREFNLVDKKGSFVPFWIYLAFSNNPPLGPSTIRGTAVPSGMQKNLAYALEASQERFNVLFSESSDPILLLSLSGEILTANQAFEKITGISARALFNGEYLWNDFVLKDDLKKVKNFLQQCVDRGHGGVIEFRLITEKNEKVWFELGIGLLHGQDKSARGLVAIARDINERKRIEQRLRERTEEIQLRHHRAQNLIDNLKTFFEEINRLPTDIHGYINGICNILFSMFKPDLVLVNVDDSEGKMRSFQTGEIVSDFFKTYTLNPMPSLMCQQIMRSGLPLYLNALSSNEAFLADHYAKNLGINTYLGSALRDSKGQVRGTLSIWDKSSRSFDSLDVELITIAAFHIAARLRNEEQDRTQKQLEENLRRAQKMEAVGMLAGGIAHDFNNILSGILGFSSYLLAKVDQDSEIYRDLGLIEQSALRASDLTKQLLAFTRQKHFAKEPISMHQIIVDTLSILKRSLSKDIVIYNQLDPNLPYVLGDASQLNQVIMNLCLNAAEAMSETGGRLLVESSHRPLTKKESNILLDSRDGEYVCIRLSDTGSGMRKEVLDHIFDPFFTTKSDKGGSGLGLSIVYGIMTNHGGDIIVESEEGKGATFKLYLPVYHGRIPLSKARAEVRDFSGTEHILIVDDELIIREMAKEVLTGNGYRVDTVPSGFKALAVLSETNLPFDLILLDMVMPGMDGEATFKEIRKRNINIPVLLTTGFVEEERSDRLIQAGAEGIIHKPYKYDTLLSKIRQILDTHLLQ